MSTARLKLPETVKQPQVEERVSDVIRSLDIEKCQDSRISGCSGGEKRRLAVAAELLGDPALLFLVRSNDWFCVLDGCATNLLESHPCALYLVSLPAG